jgi:hypothetical protein
VLHKEAHAALPRIGFLVPAFSLLLASMAYLQLILAALPFTGAQVGGIGSSAAPYPNVVYPNAVSLRLSGC